MRIKPVGNRPQPRTARPVAAKPLPGKSRARKPGFLFERRFGILLGGILTVMTVLVGRAGYLQLYDREFLRSEGDARAVRESQLSPTRGMITDRNGNELAVSVRMESVWLNPAHVLEHPGVFETAEWQQLAAVVGMKPEALSAWVKERQDKRFVYLKRQLDPSLAEYVQKLRLPGVNLQQESRRYYPAAEVMAHLVGYTDIDARGIEGLERAYDGWLRGAPGKEKVVKDAQGRVVERMGVVENMQEGRDLALSIDARIQYLAYQELLSALKRFQARAGSLVAIDIETGEVLAMANAPSYNPNNRLTLRENPTVNRTRNRAMTDMYEPGSTAKVFTAVAALESGMFKPDTVLETPATIYVGGRRVHDDHPIRGGVGDVAMIIKKSSNVGVTKMALALPLDQFLGTFTKVGFGMDTGTGFPGESGGRFPQKKRYSQHELATMSFGYAFAVTPLQLAQAYAVLGAGGVKRPLSLLKVGGKPLGDQVIDPLVAHQVLAMMEHVTEEGGTGKRARVEGYRVGVKTGTARVARGGRYSDDYTSLIAGVAPLTKPRIAMAVVINEPQGDAYYGGEVAGPVFGKVMGDALRLLNVAPDDLPEPQVAATGGAGVNVSPR
ncbi:MAG: peptidoglycan glycosyltransferase FtsI [Gammaproteobacteria bacterium]|nr:peptidoglycan glycosyltransferase FtsI [Gammaproteobacteria bacterium]